MYLYYMIPGKFRINIFYCRKHVYGMWGRGIHSYANHPSREGIAGRLNYKGGTDTKNQLRIRFVVADFSPRFAYCFWIWKRNVWVVRDEAYSTRFIDRDKIFIASSMCARSIMRGGRNLMVVSEGALRSSPFSRHS